MRRFFIFTISIFIIFSFLNSQEKGDVSKNLLSKIKAAGDSKTFKNADAIIIDDNVFIQVKKDGSFVRTDYSLIKILTQRGKKRFSTQKFQYHKRYGKVKVNIARVIHDDGTYISVPESNIKDQTIGAIQQMNIFEENFRELVVQLTSAKIGDTIEIKTTVESKPILKNNYTELLLFQSFYPVINTRAIIKIPKNMPLYSIVKNGEMKEIKKDDTNFTTYTWEAKNIKALERELLMIPPIDLGLKLIVSTFKTWKDLSKYAAELNIGKIDKNPEMIKLVNSLIKDKKDKKERILAIFRYISKNIRYMGSSMDVGAFLEPHKATYTLEKKYGVCRDKSVLMISMLKIAGIHSEDVLINVNHKTDIEIPSIYFQHAIVAVEIAKGEFIYMDPTLELSSDFGESYTGGKYVLHLSEGGKSIVKNKPYTAEKSMGCINAISEISENGNLFSKITIKGKGYYDFILRQIAKQFPGTMQNFLFTKILQSIQQGTSIKKSEFGKPEELDKEYKINLEIEAKNFIKELGNFYLMKIPEGKSSADILLSLVIYNLTRLPEREYPLFLFSKSGSYIKEEVKIDKTYSIKAFPDSFEFNEPPIFVKFDVQVKNNTIFFKRDFKIETSILLPDDYKKLKKAFILIDKFNKSFVILEKGAVK
jgi:hypothetical protein